jgi:hypothetical protein
MLYPPELREHMPFENRVPILLQFCFNFRWVQEMASRRAKQRCQFNVPMCGFLGALRGGSIEIFVEVTPTLN